MTLTDREYQQLRNIAKSIFEKVGMETGGANIQFAVHPLSGRIIVVEMNPRVSRSSALVSKATGYPIARIAAQLAVGLTLGELKNEITQNTSAAFEPSIDYVVVKIPRWDFAKYKGASDLLGVQMKSVGEVLAFGRTFRDAFQKAWRSLELGYEGWPDLRHTLSDPTVSGLSDDDWRALIVESLSAPTPDLFPAVKSALQMGLPVAEIHARTGISQWFLYQMMQLVEVEQQLVALRPSNTVLPHAALESEAEDQLFVRAKQDGFTNAAMAKLSARSINTIEQRLEALGVKPTFKMVDSCAGEFEASTPYYYKTFEHADDNVASATKKIVILGSGPNRIGQGVEFDYSCVHAVRAAQDAGYEVILINCNPETVSTDHLVSDKLFIEPLHREDVLDILRAEKPDGVFVQFGGQSPLKLAKDVLDEGFKILGTPQSVIELAENRDAFGQFIATHGFSVPAWATGLGRDDCLSKAESIGYPLLVRPSYVLGGRAMKIVRSRAELDSALSDAIDAAQGHPVLLDKYLDAAIEFDVDLVCDGERVFIPAVMEHVEEAGVHSGDSTSVIPCLKVSPEVENHIRDVCEDLALKLGVVGLLNVQLALHQGHLYILEVNPRSSRSVPFVSKATGVPLAWLGARVALGARLEELHAHCVVHPTTFTQVAVKAPVFPFHKFPGVSPNLGPEMRSIGEVMGVAATPGEAMAKAFIAAGWTLRPGGDVLLLTESNEWQELMPALQRCVDEMGCRLLGVRATQSSAFQSEVSMPVSEIEPAHVREVAETAMRSGRLSAVIAVGQKQPPEWQSLINEIGALTTQCSVPFIESKFAVEAWVGALVARGEKRVDC